MKLSPPYPHTEDKDKLYDLQTKTLKSCIATIKSHFYKIEIEKIKNEIRNENNEEKKENLYKQCMDTVKKLNKLHS
jgi:hypothetical protein